MEPRDFCLQSPFHLWSGSVCVNQNTTTKKSTLPGCLSSQSPGETPGARRPGSQTACKSTLFITVNNKRLRSAAQRGVTNSAHIPLIRKADEGRSQPRPPPPLMHLQQKRDLCEASCSIISTQQSCRVVSNTPLTWPPQVQWQNKTVSYTITAFRLKSFNFRGSESKLSLWQNEAVRFYMTREEDHRMHLKAPEKAGKGSDTNSPSIGLFHERCFMLNLVWTWTWKPPPVFLGVNNWWNSLALRRNSEPDHSVIHQHYRSPPDSTDKTFFTEQSTDGGSGTPAALVFQLQSFTSRNTKKTRPRFKTSRVLL